MGKPVLKPSSQLSGFGRVVTGSVLDCNKQALERSLQFYDPFLYIKWNTDKLGGRGCWEIRRRPERLTNVFHGVLDGKRIYTSERVESDIIHHVLDLPYLRYDVLGKIKSMDAWKHKDFNSYLENTAAEWEERERKQARDEMQYNIKQFKREWREFAALVRSGADPAQFIKGIKG